MDLVRRELGAAPLSVQERRWARPRAAICAAQGFFVRIMCMTDNGHACAVVQAHLGGKQPSTRQH